jgi:hypothetical protein
MTAKYWRFAQVEKVLDSSRQDLSHLISRDFAVITA